MGFSTKRLVLDRIYTVLYIYRCVELRTREPENSSQNCKVCFYSFMLCFGVQLFKVDPISFYIVCGFETTVSDDYIVSDYLHC